MTSGFVIVNVAMLCNMYHIKNIFENSAVHKIKLHKFCHGWRNVLCYLKCLDCVATLPEIFLSLSFL